MCNPANYIASCTVVHCDRPHEELIWFMSLICLIVWVVKARITRITWSWDYHMTTMQNSIVVGLWEYCLHCPILNFSRDLFIMLNFISFMLLLLSLFPAYNLSYHAVESNCFIPIHIMFLCIKVCSHVNSYIFKKVLTWFT